MFFPLQVLIASDVKLPAGSLLVFNSLCLFITEKGMAPHSSTLAWKIPWTEDPGRLQSMGLLRVGHDWVISLSCIGEGSWNPLQYSCLENPRDGGACWAAVYGVTQSWTRLMRLSSSSSSRKEETQHRLGTVLKFSLHLCRMLEWHQFLSLLSKL